MNVFWSMAAFALAASISPGPVNIMALRSGARYGFAASLRHVTGATVGFTVLLVLTGLGLSELLLRWPGTTPVIRWSGVLFLLYMAWRLAADSGELGSSKAERAGEQAPSIAFGALMQWLNPKAWLAAVAGMGAYAAEGGAGRVWLFAAIYFAICYVSIACWAWAGSHLRHYLSDTLRMRRFNRLMAALLAGSALYLLDVG
jgi:threonine/homoserine/homoserine lactone efflux protein